MTTNADTHAGTAVPAPLRNRLATPAPGVAFDELSARTLKASR